MNRVTLILTFLLSLMFSSPSYSEWAQVTEDANGNTHYVDFERIRKHDGYVYHWVLTDNLEPDEVDGYVYWWSLTDNLEPDEDGYLSCKTYHRGDCKLFRYKSLSMSFHKDPMGRGTGDSDSPKNPEWEYPPPNSAIEDNLKSVCSR